MAYDTASEVYGLYYDTVSSWGRVAEVSLHHPYALEITADHSCAFRDTPYHARLLPLRAFPACGR